MPRADQSDAVKRCAAVPIEYRARLGRASNRVVNHEWVYTNHLWQAFDELRAALDAAERRNGVLAEECMAWRALNDVDHTLGMPISHAQDPDRFVAAQRVGAARRATDENGGLGTLSTDSARAAVEDASAIRSTIDAKDGETNA